MGELWWELGDLSIPLVTMVFGALWTLVLLVAGLCRLHPGERREPWALYQTAGPLTCSAIGLESILFLTGSEYQPTWAAHHALVIPAAGLAAWLLVAWALRHPRQGSLPAPR